MKKYNVKRDIKENRTYRYIGGSFIENNSSYTREYTIEANNMDDAINKVIKDVIYDDEDEITIYTKTDDVAFIGSNYFNDDVQDYDLDFDEFEVDEDIKIHLIK
jgi:hypothetical protein